VKIEAIFCPTPLERGVSASLKKGIMAQMTPAFMKSKTYKTQTQQAKLAKFLTSTAAGLAAACIMMCGYVMQAQTLQLRYTFADGPGTTTTSSGALPVVLNLVSNTTSPNVSYAFDLHGPANSGVQETGGSLNLSGNPISGNPAAAGPPASPNLPTFYAVTTNNATLGTGLGLVSNFTATVWLKFTSLITNTLNNQCRFFVLGTNGVTDSGAQNDICMEFGPGAGGVKSFPQNSILLNLNNASSVTAPIYYNFPTNVWLFVGLTYDSGSGNASIYLGSEASPAKLYSVKTIGPGTNFNFGSSATLSIGNRPTGARDFPGWIDDFRFYTGTGDANFIESVRQASTPVVISGLTPDGSVLMSGTNVLSFTASSANSINTNNIKVAVNGADVSSSLIFGGSPTSVTVQYTNLPVNPTVSQETNLNAVAVNIQVTDNGGIVTSNSYAYDAFAGTNFTWECEDYDFGGGLYIDNPVYTFSGPAPNTYNQELTNYVNLTDANDNGTLSGPSRVYRDPLENVETEYSVGGPANGGPNATLGELMRQKVRDAFALDPTIRDVNVGYFDYGVGSGLPNWMNYTKTYPTGKFNIYLRVAYGGGAGAASLDAVTSGWGTSAQTTTNLGTFTEANSGGWDSFAWVPLRDAGGNLAKVTLSGTNTIRLTAGIGGGGNVNFFMLTPANTNLPAISGIYPNGTNMFQPSATFSFTASSPAGITINTNSIKVQFSVTNLLGQGYVTNLTDTNGLTITGTITNRSVTAVLASNSVYIAVISVTDANGSSAGNTVSFDTISPSYTWEAEDYDYGDGQYFDNPQTNAYVGLSGASGVDSFTNGTDANLQYNYRAAGGLGDQADGDQPPRLQYIGTGFASYNVGWYDTGDWGNYTRTYPTGSFNLFMRAADGTGTLGDTVSRVTSGWGTTNQTTVNLGTFTIPGTGNWQGYEWVPLRDTGGNLIKLTLGGTNTLRVTANAGGGGNANFYMLLPANTNLPTLNNIYPNGTNMFQSTNTFSFNVLSSIGVASNSIVVTVNGITVSNLVFSGSINNWHVSYPHLQPGATYTVVVSVTDLNGNNQSTTVSFDTFSSASYTWEGEDFDYDGGQFFDNPQTNAYKGFGAVSNVDTLQVNFNVNAPYAYRTNSDALPDNSPGMATEINGDVQRSQYQGTGFTDYTMGYFSVGAWANYTRHYPAGTYTVEGRLAAGAAVPTMVALSQVTAGFGTSTQTTNSLGTFTVQNTGWEAYSFVPLRDNSGNLVTLTFNGSTNTMQVSMPTGAGSDCNVNFFMLVPIFTIQASHSGTNVVISFLTQSGFNYQVQYKTNLTDPTWNSLGSPVAGNNAIKSVNDPANGTTRFYRVQIQ
jgi:hypothetical protein